MSAFSSLILTQLTVPPGDLIYYVVLVFAVASALQSAFNHWRATEFPQARRAFMGLGIILIAQVVMFIFSGLGWQHIFDPKLFCRPWIALLLYLALSGSHGFTHSLNPAARQMQQRHY